MAYYNSITINNYGFGSMVGCCMPRACRPYPMPIFGCGYRRPICCFPMSPAYFIGAAAGGLAAAAIAYPELGKALAWPFKQLWKGATWTWKSVIKPVANWAWNGIKKAWNAVTGLFKKKKNKKAKEAQES